MRYILVAIAVMCVHQAAAQRYPERGMVRAGNARYNEGKFTESEVDYRRALERNPEMEEAKFNLADALFKQGNHAEAEQLFGEVAQVQQAAGRNVDAARSLFNAANALAARNKTKEAIDQLKESLRLNPGDVQAKFNYAYLKKKLEEEQQQNQDQQDKQNQENQQDKQNQKDQQDKQDQKDQQDKQDQKDQQQDRKQDQKEQNQQDQNQQNQPEQNQNQQPVGMNRQEARQMLEAIQMSEDKTREKVAEGRRVEAAAHGGKNW